MSDLEQLVRDLAARVGVLEQRNDALEQQNATLLERVDVQPVVVSSPDEGSGTPLERLSRRWILRRGMQTAAASVAAGVLVQHDARQAAASHSTDYIEANILDVHQIRVVKSNTDMFSRGMWVTNQVGGAGVYAETTSTDHPALYGHNFGSDPGVFGSNAGTGPAVHGQAGGAAGTGVQGTGRIGVWGESFQDGFDGVFGRNTVGNGVRGTGLTGVRGDGRAGVHGSSSTTGYEGVYGEFTGTSGYGVVGDGKGSNASGVLGRNPAGVGVRGEGTGGVHGLSSVAGNTGVTGEHTGANGFGVVGLGKGTGAGVFGSNGAGTGLRGDGKIGVTGTATTSGGYGGQFGGGKAQLRLVPSGTAGKPDTGTHSKGEMVLDATATLWICTATGTPGAWRKVSTTVS